MNEDEETRILANRILDRPSGDPDDDLAMLSRQLLRADEQLALVDEALARRPAVADTPNRYTAICSAFEMASRTQKAEAEAKHWKFHYEKQVALSQRPADPAWISVSERLPDDKNPVLVFVAGFEQRNGVRMACYDKTEPLCMFWHGWQLGKEQGVTHWQPLPTPPLASPVPKEKE